MTLISKFERIDFCVEAECMDCGDHWLVPADAITNQCTQCESKRVQYKEEYEHESEYGNP